MTKVDYCCEDNHLIDNELTVGVITKQLLNRLLDNGDIDENAKKTIYKSVRSFYVDAVSQALQKLPFTDDLLIHSKSLNFQLRAHCSFSSVEYFCSTYSTLLQFGPAVVDRLQEEFIDFQLLEETGYLAGSNYCRRQKRHRTLRNGWGHIATICNADGLRNVIIAHSFEHGRFLAV